MITLQATDSKKRTRALTVKDWHIDEDGSKHARIKSDNGETYNTTVYADGSGTCNCKSRGDCYHRQALASVDLEAEQEKTDIVAAAVEVVRQHEEKTTVCPHCHKTDVNYSRYGRCYWMPIYEAL